MQISEVACEILIYLTDHPDSQGTLDEIVEWWLLEQEVKRQISMVKEALKELIERGYILENKRWNSKVYYRLNQKKSEEITLLLKQ